MIDFAVLEKLGCGRAVGWVRALLIAQQLAGFGPTPAVTVVRIIWEQPQVLAVLHRGGGLEKATLDRPLAAPVAGQDEHAQGTLANAPVETRTDRGCSHRVRIT